MLNMSAVTEFVEMVFARKEEVCKDVNNELTCRLDVNMLPEDTVFVYTVSVTRVDASIEFVNVEYVFVVVVFRV